MPDADPPEAAVVMLRAKVLNDYLGTSYTLAEVAEMDGLLFDILGALKQGLNPPESK